MRSAKEELEARLAEQEAVSNLGQKALGGSGVAALMEEAAASVARALRAEYSYILELLPKEETLILQAGVGWRDGAVGKATVPADRGFLCGFTLAAMEPVVVEDMAREARFRPSPLLAEHGVVGGITVVVHGRDRPFGVLGAYTTRPRVFSRYEIRFLQSMAGVLGLAIEHRQADEALKHSDTRFQTFMDNSPAVAFLKDAEGRHVYVNKQFERVFKKSHVDVWGKTARDLWPEAPAEIFDHDRTALETGRTVEAIERLPAPDGAVRDWLIYKFPLELGAGRRFVAGLGVDITERLRAEERLRALLESAPDAIVLADRDGRMTLVNSQTEKMFGYRREEMLGQPVEMLVPERYRQNHPRHRAEYMAGPRTRPMGSGLELRGRRKDGTEFPAEISLSPLETEAGLVVLATVRDITERKRAEEERESLHAQLTQAQKLQAVGRLAAGIAHEINSPLQFIGDNARFLKEAFGEIAKICDGAGAVGDWGYLREQVPRAIQQSLEGIDRVYKIVRAMKEYAHPGTEEKVDVDLNKVVETAVTLTRNEWKYVANVTTDLDRSLPPLTCYHWEISEVLVNLIVNAAYAIAEAVGDGSRGKGTIAISTRRDGDWVEIQVRDTGTGIPEEIRPRMFEPFFTTKGVGKGTGQGLAICRSIVVNRHGGTIRFESEVGEGTTFIVRLPLRA